MATRANQVVLHFVERSSLGVLKSLAATTNEDYTTTCQATAKVIVVLSNQYVCPQCGQKKLNKLDDTKNFQFQKGNRDQKGKLNIG